MSQKLATKRPLSANRLRALGKLLDEAIEVACSAPSLKRDGYRLDSASRVWRGKC